MTLQKRFTILLLRVNMNKTNFDKIIASSKPKSVYILYGEPYLVDEALRKLIEIIFKKNKPNIETYDGEECEITEILQGIRNISLFSPQKLIVIKRSDELKKQHLETLLPHLENPPENTYIVLTGSSEIKDKKFIDTIEKKYGTVFVFSAYKKADDLREFTIVECERAGISLTPEAIDTLIELSGLSLYNLKNEIEKLKNLSKGKDKITEEDVENSVFGEAKDDFYGILNGIVARNALLAMKSIRGVIKKETDYLQILSSIVTYLQGIYNIRKLIDAGLDKNEIFIQSGEKNRYSFERKFTGAERYTAHELYQLLNKLAHLDLTLKSSALNKLVLFDDFFLSLEKGLKVNSL